MMKTKRGLFVIKALDEETGVFEGYASVWGVRDVFNEVTVPGAFTDSLVKQSRAGNWPLMLWQHNPDEPIGVWEDIAEDEKGLRVKGRLLKGVQRAEEVYVLMKAGAVRGLSIGYVELEAEAAKDGEPRKLIKLDLMEVSVVSFPALRRARVDMVKSDAEENSEKWKRFEDWVGRIADGEVPPPSVFEDLLRDARRMSKSQRARFASRVHAVLRSESGDDEADVKAIEARITEMRSLIEGFSFPSIKD
jgi:HK97 family phage prohead protease